MKKSLLLLIALILTISATGCGLSATATTGFSTTTDGTTALTTTIASQDGNHLDDETTSVVYDQPEYVTALFDKSRVIDIDIAIEATDWDTLIEMATEEQFVSSDITMDGNLVTNAGIRAKGNSTLLEVLKDPDSDRFSFRINLEKYVDGQRLFGLKSFVLNNCFADPSYMKEFLAYEMMSAMGIPTPAHVFANVTMNGEAWGLYLAVEVIEEDFLARMYGSDYGNLYKPEVESIVGGIKTTLDVRGANLVYIDDDDASYPAIFNFTKTAATTLDDAALVIAALQHLANSTDLPTYFDIREVLKYFAVNTFLVNMDSYAGNLKHNYYLYEHNGQIQILPWDFNMAFGGYRMRNGAEVVNFPIDAPYIDTAANTPLIVKLLEVELYRTTYHAYLTTLLSVFVENNQFSETVDRIDGLIATFVQADPTAFYTYAEYRIAIIELKTYGIDRTTSILAQLSGLQPTTRTGNVSTTLNLVSLGGGRLPPRP